MQRHTEPVTPVLEQEDALSPDHTPETVVNRGKENDALTDYLSNRTHFHVYGPRGTGKTLLLRNALGDLSDTETYTVSCATHDTQYKVLAQLADAAVGHDIGTGYHTAQLQEYVADLFQDNPAVIVLDDIDFLLANDGNDLLYFLSRLDRDHVSVVTVSSNHPSLLTVVDERTYSSLQPRRLYVEPYTVQETYQILENRARTAFAQDAGLPKDALSTIAASTANIHLALIWLREAATTGGDEITEEVLRDTRPIAVRQYREHLLDDFSIHHRLLCNVIDDLTDDTDSVHTGEIYDAYQSRCGENGDEPLTDRRVSDHLKDLERLHIIEAEYHYGGTEGKTRTVQFRQT